jgi:putative Mg2+ transporter-C (MgtC) family protein
VLGGVIGLEREISGKQAGLRTNILICVGAALLSDISVKIGRLDNGTVIGDPARIAAQIVTGVGFLGAGTILQSRGTVVGLTTAATLWVVAAIGIAIGAGYFVEAIGTGIMVTFVLAGLGKLEHRVRRIRRVVIATIRAQPKTPLEELESVLSSLGIRILSKGIYDHVEDRTFELRLAGPARQFDVAQDKLASNPHVIDLHLGH